MPQGGLAAWSADSRLVYFATAEDSTRHWTIKVASPEGGPVRTLVYGNDPLTQGRKFGFAISAGQFFFPLVERQGDIWVAEVRSR